VFLGIADTQKHILTYERMVPLFYFIGARMTDWFRSLDAVGLLVFGLTCLAWGGGGWLAVRSWFTPRAGERLVSGLAAGFVTYLTLVNLLTPLSGLPVASALSAGLILAAGLGAAWRLRPSRAELIADLRDWPQIVVMLALTLLFEMAQRGVSIFDEYLHLPMVSTMGTGIIPPRFYLNPELSFAYHYGLQIFAAVLENIPRFFPWSAWDLTRGLAIALTFNLGWLWVRRGTGRGVAGVLGSALFVLGGGARWLLLLLPGSVLAWVGQGVRLSNTGADTASNLGLALSRPWVLEGGGTMPFPFAYHNGVFVADFFILGSTGSLPALTLLLLLLLARPYPSLRNLGGIATLTLIIANLALSAEHVFAFLWLGLALVGVWAVLHAWRQKQPFPREQVLAWGVILVLSAILGAVQGGFVTETLRNTFLGLIGQRPASSNVYGFALRWPPAISSAHMGQLSPFDLRQLVALLAEMGPALLAAPLATWWAWRAARRGDWMAGGLGLTALLMLLFTLLVEYGVDRSSTRFAGSSLWLWLVLAFPMLWWAYQRGSGLKRAWLGSLFFISLWGGLVIFAIQITSIPEPIPAYFVDSLDLSMSRKYWNQLESGAQVLDSNPERAVTVFGRISKARSAIYVFLPEWEKLMEEPTPQKVAAFGYSYVYMSPKWWNGFSPALRQTYQQPCVKLVDEVKNKDGANFRRLYDIQSCR
jgi:hypothetical protein